MADKFFLSQADGKRRQELEQTIKKHLTSFVIVGKALAEIKSKKLWETTHKSFEVYCDDIFKISRSYASRIIEGARIVKLLPQGNNLTERHVRPLHGLPVPVRKKAFKEAMSVAKKEERNVTPQDVRNAVATLVPPRKKSATDEIGRPVPAPLLDLWHRRNESQQYLTMLSKVKSAMKLAEEVKDPLYNDIHFQTIFTHVDAVYHTIKFSTPYAVCGLCQGMKCKVCKTGLMSRLQWDQLVPKETRDRLVKKYSK